MQKPQRAGHPRKATAARRPYTPSEKSGGDGVVAFERFADLVGGNGAFAANAPVIAAEFDDGRRTGVVGFAGVKDERETIAKLGEDFDATGTCGRTGNVGAGAGERDAEFGNEINNDFRLGPAESDAARVGSDFQGKAVGSVNDNSERTGPAGLRETKEIVGKIAGENLGVDERADENGKSLGFGAPFDAENFFDGREVDGISGERVKGVGGNSDNRAAI